MSIYIVTGAAGFIASRVSAYLLNAGHRVIGVDNLNDAYDVRLKEWRLAALLDQPGFDFVKADISDQSIIGRLLEKSRAVDAVLNLAARAGVRQSVENPWVYLDANATGTLNMLEFCRRSNTRKFVLSSTSSLYGAHNPLPYSEDADTTRPLSPYAASKKAAEAMCFSYHHLYGVDVSVLRYFTVYGPAGRPDMAVFRFVQAIREGRQMTVYGDGKQSRDFTYIDDIARGTVAALKPVGFRVVNLGSDRPVALADVISTIEGEIGRKANIQYRPAHEADVPATWANIGVAREVLGWQPETDYRTGIRNAVEWYLANREFAMTIAPEVAQVAGVGKAAS